MAVYQCRAKDGKGDCPCPRKEDCAIYPGGLNVEFIPLRKFDLFRWTSLRRRRSIEASVCGLCSVFSAGLGGAGALSPSGGMWFALAAGVLLFIAVTAFAKAQRTTSEMIKCAEDIQ